MTIHQAIDDDAVNAADGDLGYALSRVEGRRDGKTPARSVRRAWRPVMAVFVSIVVALGATTLAT